MTVSEENVRSTSMGMIDGIENPFHFHPWMNALLHTFKKIREGQLVVILPDGIRYQFGNDPETELIAEIRFFSYEAPKQILKAGDIGFGESYISGEWESPDLLSLMRLLLANEQAFNSGLAASSFTKLNALYRRLFKRNNLRNSKKNIEYHYDLGNDFYSLWLDPTMTYSSAIFEDPEDDLEKAQLRKYTRIGEIAGIKAGDKVLEIGCGWGGFAEVAADIFKAETTGLTLSKEQLVFAKNRLEGIPSTGQANFLLQDFREHKGRYDAIVSIEMFEAIGVENWPRYFKTLHKNLLSGGKAAVQVITISEDRFDRYKGKQDFIQKHIFPGGFLPTKSAFIEAAEKENLCAKACEEFGTDYALTLNKWHARFLERWPEINGLGYDETFKRKWEMYLKYCEAGFLHKTIDVVIFEVSKP
ncbi:methyltransferase domain-containing protein [Sneathiella sp. P13V-1]|uniref:SAM-dependent methyltransferase n=1 Tax=Sneathiella sp. P13V-1 TaxID=2697366 RepID=UPI00187BC2DD|nr:cyclopropane-fatty-acyl-phospholipid synthase family protein [Sneathiella sp. P13V-1]MBE7636614.1 methyltransferase domain-containing protein [Sneathiella sp. P13V-1]